MKIKKVDPEKAGETARQRFREFRSELFKVLPDDCLLKDSQQKSQGLPISMVAGIWPLILKMGLYKKEDICMLCDKTECRWYKQLEQSRCKIIKVWILSKLNRFLKTAVIR